MIKNVSITNFKSLGDVSVDLDSVTVLIGRSGTGKSNFLDAMRFLRDCAKSLYWNQAVANQGGLNRIIPVAPIGNGPINLSFSVLFSGPGLAEHYQYLLILRPNQPSLSLVEEKLSLGGNVLFHRKEGRWIQVPKVVNPPAPNTGTLLLGAITGVREITRAQLLLGDGLAFYMFPDEVLLLSPGQSAAEFQNGLTGKGQNFLQVLIGMDTNPQAWNHQQEMVAALRQLNPSIKSVELNMPNRDRIVVSHEVAGRVLPLELTFESEGLRRLLAHLIALYQTPSKQTLFFEEPEKGIHPGALAVLAGEFKACPDSARGQVILTTHSPELLDHFEPEQLRVVEMDNYLTKIGSVAPQQVEAIRDQLLHPGELMTVDMARLAAPILEGQ